MRKRNTKKISTTKIHKKPNKIHQNNSPKIKKLALLIKRRMNNVIKI